MSETPSETPSGAGRGGIVPPVEHRFRVGGPNPGVGRPPNAGRSLKEIVNDFTHQELDRPALLAISRNPKSPCLKVIAANRLLAAMERSDLADFEPLLDGQMSARELRAQGVDTTALKKIKQKTRTIPPIEKGGEPTIEVEREIELRERAQDNRCRTTHHHRRWR